MALSPTRLGKLSIAPPNQKEKEEMNINETNHDYENSICPECGNWLGVNKEECWNCEDHSRARLTPKRLSQLICTDGTEINLEDKRFPFLDAELNPPLLSIFITRDDIDKLFRDRR